MNGSVNIPHYNVETLSPSTQKMVKEGKLLGPEFVGQGCTHGCGSDRYGYYILEIKTTAKGKPLIGLAQAKTVMHGEWTEGTEDCSIDLATAKPTAWITPFGNNVRTGRPQWYFCDKDGNRFKGEKCHYGFNGAYAYRDPSF